jgi:hypothetical protein
MQPSLDLDLRCYFLMVLLFLVRRFGGSADSLLSVVLVWVFVVLCQSEAHLDPAKRSSTKFHMFSTKNCFIYSPGLDYRYLKEQVSCKEPP